MEYGCAQQWCCFQAQAEIKALNTFLELMSTSPDRAFYGYKHVKAASDQLAIDTLMVSDSLFRSKNILQRRKYVRLVETVRDQVLHCCKRDC